MELVSASTKTEEDDNGECSSSSAVAAEVAGEDQSEKDQCVSILRRQGAFEGAWPGKTLASAKSIGDGSGSCSSSSRPCKKCFHKGSPAKMLICDNCEDSFHVSCCNPRVKRIPVDEWLCRSCWKKKWIIPKETISRKSLNKIGDMGRCRDASSIGESNPIASMLRDNEPYTGDVRVGKGFQVEVPDWSGPIINDVDSIGKPVVLEPSYFVSLFELKSNKSSKLGSIGNWLQCRQVIDDAAGGGNVTTCGKWRR
ncbi:HISTONE ACETYLTRANSFERASE [Salix purpurea]|uniref:HISTONE ACETYLTRANSFERASE n=1 Tax=Salix purpurea TaxID=77065 RepID=A0A9Q0Q4L7_SALPP|nr:HISTONE ACETYLTRANSFERASE [Salix purpurea]KAJ6699713.1 HISTONE ACETYLTRANSFERASE [Salix purpurea]